MKSTDVSVPENEDCPVGELRWFAGLAMQAIIEKQPTTPDSQSEREEIALWSYRMAEAMVATEKRLGL